MRAQSQAKPRCDRAGSCRVEIPSQSGHSLFNYEFRCTMSALPPRADMCGALVNVRFVPIADAQQKGSLFNQLIGGGEERRGYGQAQCLCSLEIDNHLELSGLFDREICGLYAFEDSFNIRGSPTI
jgi:hypothetical protein